MEFCPKCDAMLIKKTKNLGCPRCSYNSSHSGNLKISEKMEKIKEVAVVSKNIEVNQIGRASCRERV